MSRRYQQAILAADWLATPLFSTPWHFLARKAQDPLPRLSQILLWYQSNRCQTLDTPSGAGMVNRQLALNRRILESGLMNEKEFGATPEACQRIADDPDIWMTYFMVTQVWAKSRPVIFNCGMMIARESASSSQFPVLSSNPGPRFMHALVSFLFWSRSLCAGFRARW